MMSIRIQRRSSVVAIPRLVVASTLLALFLLSGKSNVEAFILGPAPSKCIVPSTSTRVAHFATLRHPTSTSRKPPFSTSCPLTTTQSFPAGSASRTSRRSSSIILQSGKASVANDDEDDDSKSSNKAKKSSTSLSAEAAIYMSLLALQFGLQPGLVRKYTPQTITRSTVVMMQELLKVIISAFVLFGGSKATRKEALKGWNLKTALMIGGLPAALYCVQNMAALMAYQNLEPLTFNVLNQTKTLSAALCCYLIIGRKQSKRQMISLVILLASALIIEKVIKLSAPFVSFGAGGGGGAAALSASATQHFTQGVAPILLASFISGLAGALAQKNLQSASGDAKGGRNPYLFNMEMNSASALILVISLFFSADGTHIAANGFFDGWTPQTWIPIVTNALGGIIVGLVTKHAGAVRKGFALIFGILISGLWEVQTAGITKEQVVGGILAAISLWMHTSFPYKSKEERSKK